MKTLKIRDTILGSGRPKVCVPIMGKDKNSIVDEAQFIMKSNPDLVEWRADYFEQLEDVKLLKEALFEIRRTVKEKPLIFTFRSSKEGGVRSIPVEQYFTLNKLILNTGDIDIIDLELCRDERSIRDFIAEVHKTGVKVILSSHNIKRTPTKEFLLDTFERMQMLGADIPKIAVMANTEIDLLTLLEATNTIRKSYADRPFITVSMGEKGLVSRLCGGLFGSAVTFATGKEASAPGQIKPEDLYKVLSILHNEKEKK